MNVNQHDDGSTTITTEQGSMRLTPENWHALVTAAKQPGTLDGPWTTTTTDEQDPTDTL